MTKFIDYEGKAKLFHFLEDVFSQYSEDEIARQHITEANTLRACVANVNECAGLLANFIDAHDVLDSHGYHLDYYGILLGLVANAWNVGAMMSGTESAKRAKRMREVKAARSASDGAIIDKAIRETLGKRNAFALTNKDLKKHNLSIGKTAFYKRRNKMQLADNSSPL